MPIIDHSSFTPPRLLANGHLQTIIPNYFAHLYPVNYEREIFNTPDQDKIALDWSRRDSDRLIIINHGLCGHTYRHYVRSFVKTFNDAGWDCLAWNYRCISDDSFLNPKLALTTNNSSNEIEWLVNYAIQRFNYRKIAITGFSMGGNLALLYLGRHAQTLPQQVVGGAVVCAVSDLFASSDKTDLPQNKIYSQHLVKKLKDLIIKKHDQFPDQIDLQYFPQIRTFKIFDDIYTAPMTGFKNHVDYWQEASAANYCHLIDRPTLMIAPMDDPFLAGGCYPLKQAEKSKELFLEMPKSGGHCGFISAGHTDDWWPAARARDFLAPAMNAN